MKALIPVLLMAAAVLPAQQHSEYQAWMKSAGAAAAALGKLDPATGPQAVSGAERLAAVYENMIGFWRQRNAEGAVKWSQQGKAAAVQLAGAASAGDAEKAAAAMSTLSGTCRSCHEKHRETLPGGRYRMIERPPRP